MGMTKNNADRQYNPIQCIFYEIDATERTKRQFGRIFNKIEFQECNSWMSQVLDPFAFQW